MSVISGIIIDLYGVFSAVIAKNTGGGIPPVPGGFFLLETGDHFLLETGDSFLLE